MELIEICEGGLIPVSSSSNLILPSYNNYAPGYHYIGDMGGLQLIQEATPLATTGDLVQVIEPSQSGVVNYVCGADGTLLPVYDSFSGTLDNAPIFITTEQDDSDPGIPPHVLDHMYAKKPKEPGSETTPKPRKRVRKKQHVVKECKPPLIMSNTAKVNIIRKGQVTPLNPVVRQIATRPKILQAKSGNVVHSTSTQGTSSGITNVVSLAGTTPPTPPKPPAVDRWTSRRRNAATANILSRSGFSSLVDGEQNDEASFYLSSLSSISREALSSGTAVLDADSIDTSLTQLSVNDPQIANYCIMLPPGQDLAGGSLLPQNSGNEPLIYATTESGQEVQSIIPTLQPISLPNNIYFSLT